MIGTAAGDTPIAMSKDVSNPDVFTYNGELQDGTFRISRDKEGIEAVTEEKQTYQSKYAITFDAGSQDFAMEQIVVYEKVWAMGQAISGDFAWDKVKELTQSSSNKNEFVYEGELGTGQIKFPLQFGDYNGLFFVPEVDNKGVYDEFMDQTPYDEWLLNILNVFKEYKIKKAAQVLDLGCGTGKMSRRLAREGYQVTAVDNSMDMLEIAASEEEDHILYVLQDMVSLELPQQVDAAVSICDCMNYILEEDDLKEAFRRVMRFLKEDGVFIFDMNSHYKYKEILACNTFAEDREDASFIWDNFYDEEDRINEYQLSLFIQNEEGTYNKYEELHLQKAYEEGEITRLLHEAGFSTIRVLDAETMGEVKEDTQRLYFIAN